jgi:BirA family biotin operon repressor/biotin-[acetyl-CoA-carboxylase] ligase
MERPPLDLDALRDALGERWPQVQVVEQTGSTNSDLIADAAAPDRSLLAAEDQVSGRGRLDRTWITPARAGLTFTVLLRPATPITTWAWLPLLAGVALRDAVSEVAGVETGLKWPNDLLAGDERKLAGILAQTSGEAVAIGIGLNVSTRADELPVDTATSLALCGAEADRTRLLIAIATHLDHRVLQWTDVHGEAEACGLAADYAAACVTLGREVRVSTLDGSELTGHAVQIASDGRLLVDIDGELTAVGAGDVTHVRPS